MTRKQEIFTPGVVHTDWIYDYLLTSVRLVLSQERTGMPRRDGIYYGLWSTRFWEAAYIISVGAVVTGDAGSERVPKNERRSPNVH